MIQPISPSRRRILGAAIERALTPHELSLARDMVRTDARRRALKPEPEQLLYWMRLNMPNAAGRVEAVLEPRPLVL